MRTRFLPDLLRFCEDLGFNFQLQDEGRAVVIDCPPQWRHLATAVLEYEEALKAALACREQSQRASCYGGPYDGRKHYKCPGEPFLVREARGRYAVYVVMHNWQAAFAGYATSKAKGRRAAHDFYAQHYPSQPES